MNRAVPAETEKTMIAGQIPDTTFLGEKRSSSRQFVAGHEDTACSY